MTDDLVSNIIKQFAVTVMIATAFSLLASFTIVPWLFSRYGRIEKIEGKNLYQKFILWFEKQLDKFTHWISNLLKWSLKNTWTKLTTLGIATALFIGSLALVGLGYIGTEFFPKMDRGEFLVQIELPKDSSLEQTNFAIQETEKYRSEEHTSELQSRGHLVCRLLLEKKNTKQRRSGGNKYARRHARSCARPDREPPGARRAATRDWGRGGRSARLGGRERDALNDVRQ